MNKSLKYYMHGYRKELTKTLLFAIIIGFLLLTIVGIIADQEINLGTFAVSVSISGFCLLILFVFIGKNKTLDRFMFSEKGITTYSLFKITMIKWNQIVDIRYCKMSFRGNTRNKIMIVYMDSSNNLDNFLIDMEYDVAGDLLDFLNHNFDFNDDANNLIGGTQNLSDFLKGIVMNIGVYRLSDEELNNYYKPKRIYKDNMKHTNTILGFYVWPFFSVTISSFFLFVNIQTFIIILTISLLCCVIYISISLIRGTGFDEVEIDSNSITIKSKFRTVKINKRCITKILYNGKERKQIKFKYYYVYYIDDSGIEVAETISHSFWLEECLNKYYNELVQ